MQRYGFVPRIEKIAQEELAELRNNPPGSHIDLILKECLLDIDYNINHNQDKLHDKHDGKYQDKYKDKCQNKFGQALFSKDNLWLINSFMDINPAFKDLCKGDLLRSEFLFLRYSGDNTFELYKPSEREKYVKHLEEKLFDSLPKKVIYRLCDYNNKDFNFLRGAYKSRGAARLLEQKELLEADIEIIKSLQKNGKDVEILVPYVIFPEEFNDVKKRVRDKLGDIAVGTMLEVPANLLEIGKYSNADFYVFGPGDLTKNLYGGVDKNSADFNKVNPDLVFPIIHLALNSLSSLNKEKTVYLVKNLIGHNFEKYTAESNGKFNGEHTGESNKESNKESNNIHLVNMYMPSQLITGAGK